MTGIQWQDQAHNLVGRGGNARKHGVGRGRGGPATRYQSSSRGRGLRVDGKEAIARSHCKKPLLDNQRLDRQKPVLQRQLQQKFCWFGNHCQYPYCPYWHAISTPHSAELKSFNKILPQHAQKSDILQSHLHSTIFFLKLTLPFFESYFFINPEKFSFKQRTKVNENEGENRHEHEK